MSCKVSTAKARWKQHIELKDMVMSFLLRYCFPLKDASLCRCGVLSISVEKLT